MRFVKPIDEELLHEIFSTYDRVITVEDGTIVGGFGTAVLEFMAKHQYNATIKILGIPDKLVEHGSLKELYRECEYDAIGIASTARLLLSDKVKTKQRVIE